MHSLFLYNTSKVEIAHVSINRRVNKLLYMYAIEYLLSNKKWINCKYIQHHEWISKTFCSVKEHSSKNTYFLIQFIWYPRTGLANLVIEIWTVVASERWGKIGQRQLGEYSAKFFILVGVWTYTFVKLDQVVIPRGCIFCCL